MGKIIFFSREYIFVAASYTYCLFVCHTSVYLISKLFFSYYIDIGMAHRITLDHSQLKLPEVAPQVAQINYVYHNSVQGKENGKCVCFCISPFWATKKLSFININHILLPFSSFHILKCIHISFFLLLPIHHQCRVASMPNTGIEEEYYRLRHFSITGKGIVNRGDSLKSRRSRSNNSVASSNSR